MSHGCPPKKEVLSFHLPPGHRRAWVSASRWEQPKRGVAIAGRDSCHRQRVAAAERKEGVMRRVIGLMAACLGFIAAIMLIFWIMGGFEGGGGSVSVSGWIAFALGATLTRELVRSIRTVFPAR